MAENIYNNLKTLSQNEYKLFLKLANLEFEGKVESQEYKEIISYIELLEEYIQKNIAKIPKNFKALNMYSRMFKRETNYTFEVETQDFSSPYKVVNEPTTRQEYLDFFVPEALISNIQNIWAVKLYEIVNYIIDRNNLSAIDEHIEEDLNQDIKDALSVEELNMALEEKDDYEDTLYECKLTHDYNILMNQLHEILLLEGLDNELSKPLKPRYRKFLIDYKYDLLYSVNYLTNFFINRYKIIHNKTKDKLGIFKIYMPTENSMYGNAVESLSNNIMRTLTTIFDHGYEEIFNYEQEEIRQSIADAISISENLFKSNRSSYKNQARLDAIYIKASLSLLQKEEDIKEITEQIRDVDEQNEITRNDKETIKKILNYRRVQMVKKNELCQSNQDKIVD